ncbi:hypothetical protein ABMA28_008565 [Loxostege sticticalis]|uniref:Uncharacterized protein n=1 Tax=Loxostege sticticalis TaxID=481309 RepID=A0ABD0SG10_LOXSC
MFGITMIVYIDYVLLAVLLFLTLFTCGYCVYRVYNLIRNGQIEVLMKPTKVLFTHKKEGVSTEELRTVVAYQNPFTGDYCVRKSRVGPKGYVNELQGPESPDSGLSDEYEPLNLDPQIPQATVPKEIFQDGPVITYKPEDSIKLNYTHSDNSVNKTWNWNYKEYQI